MAACLAEVCSLAGLCLSGWAVLPAFAVVEQAVAAGQPDRVTVLFRQAALSLVELAWSFAENWAAGSSARYKSGAWCNLYCDPESGGQGWPVPAGCTVVRLTCHTFRGLGPGSFLCYGRADRLPCFVPRR